MEDKNCKKQLLPQWMLNVLLTLVLGAYGYIFSTFTDRVSSIEFRVESLNPTLLQIQTDLSSIKTNIEWLKLQQEKIIY
jgi:hypothetical protein